MMKKLLEHFGNSIVITELYGKNKVVSFKNTAYALLYFFMTEQIRITVTAARHLK